MAPPGDHKASWGGIGGFLGRFVKSWGLLESSWFFFHHLGVVLVASKDVLEAAWTVEWLFWECLGVCRVHFVPYSMYDAFYQRCSVRSCL